MKFQITHQPDGYGHHITVSIDGEGKEIRQVDITLDGVVLCSESIGPGRVAYSREFRHVGSITPADDHDLEVTATDAEGKTNSSSAEWTD